MGTMKGMEPLSVENAASDLTALATAITSAVDGAQSDFEQLEWVGEDREAYKSDLVSVLEQLRAFGQQVTAMAEQLVYEVQAQRTTSSAGSL